MSTGSSITLRETERAERLRRARFSAFMIFCAVDVTVWAVVLLRFADHFRH